MTLFEGTKLHDLGRMCHCELVIFSVILNNPYLWGVTQKYNNV
jgi:hypothetical protein